MKSTMCRKAPAPKTPHAITSNFGAIVKELRERQSLSQESLGARSDLHRTYISDVECGYRNVSLTTAARIADALGISCSALIATVEKGAH